MSSLSLERDYIDDAVDYITFTCRTFDDLKASIHYLLHVVAQTKSTLQPERVIHYCS